MSNCFAAQNTTTNIVVRFTSPFGLHCRVLKIILTLSGRPEVSVVMSSNELRVGDDLYARCVGESNPAVERYEWFIGDEKFEETGAEIRVNNITKELNGQLLICQATNAIGVTTADTLLDIQCKCSTV